VIPDTNHPYTTAYHLPNDTKSSAQFMLPNFLGGADLCTLSNESANHAKQLICLQYPFLISSFKGFR